ncbi:HNH endonuclease [Agrobacterium sp. S2/73]|uniref:HNH endonuclease n=1 Tax=unclassified Agrobacterium TaxID=2632611 RepID=UPI001ADD1479|nr:MULTISPECIES: HNH endonuclease [unclassified Agrobacterium]MBO9108789.1 HNH endonuclease [Agrobacterium sp. S2/73]QXZ73454.1 HNH endonuclease [Agrobacterium sp. S7/73]
MSRSTEEWVAKHDDQKVPPRVRQRVFDRHNGICHLTGRKIQPGERWELEHVHALILGGQHRESNLAPALAAAHKVKTAAEMKVKSKIARVRKKHIGIAKPKSSLSHPNLKRLMDGTVVDRRTGEIVGGRQP